MLKFATRQAQKNFCFKEEKKKKKKKEREKKKKKRAIYMYSLP